MQDLYPSRLEDENIINRVDPVVYSKKMITEHSLNKEQLDSYERNGFIVFPKLFSKDEIKAFKEELKSLESNIELRKKEDVLQDFDGLILPGGESTVQGKLLKELDMHDLPQYQAEAPFVLVLEDGTAIKAVKKLEQFFAGSPVEQHHYLYCKPVAGHTQNLAKLFGLMLGAHWSNRQVVFIYEDNFKAFIQDFPEMA